MATEKHDIPEVHNDQNTVIEAPPSWAEVMAEKNGTSNDLCDKNDPKTDTHKQDITENGVNPLLYDKNDPKTDTHTQDVTKNGVNLLLCDKNDPKTETHKQDITENGVNHEVTSITLDSEILKEKDITDQNQTNENTNAVSNATYFRKFINCLKMMSALTTIISDIVLMACGIALIYVGDTVIKEKDDLIKVSLFYKKQYRATGQSLVAFGIIYLTIIVPFGILGVLRHNKKLLKWHNIWLLLNLLAEGIIFYIIFKHLYKTNQATRFDNFDKELKKFYDFCMNNGKGKQCCCYLRGQQNEKLCFDYFADDNFRSCIRHEDLFNRTQKVLKLGIFYLPIFMTIQLTAFCFGTIQSKVITSQDTSLRKRKRKRANRPKNKFQKIWQKSTHLIYRRILFCVFAILLVIIFFVAKLWYNNFKVRIGTMTVDVIDFTKQQIEDNI